MAKDAAATKELQAMACSKVATDHDIEAEEEEEDLFEINLDVGDNIPPPLYWESHFTATTPNVVLLANCLLPIADLSKAVPTVEKACDHAFSWHAGSFSAEESVPGKLMGVPTFDTFGLQDYCIKKQKHEL